MKTTLAVAVAVALASASWAGSSVQAQEIEDEWEYAPHSRYVEADLQRLEKAYVYALSFSVEGVMESALREVARVKVAHLEWEADKLVERLDEISRGGMSPGIRYKASLVKAMFETPAIFTAEAGKDFRTPSELYRTVARRLETNLLAGT